MASEGDCSMQFYDGQTWINTEIPSTNRKVAQHLHKLVLKFMGTIPLEEKHPFTFCDYGTGDGSHSLVGGIIDSIRKLHGNSQDIHLVFNDLPGNDFGNIFSMTQKPCDNDKRVSAVVSGRSFYGQCLPSSTVHLAFCNMSIHWISKIPMKLQNTHYCLIDSSQEELDIWAKVAHDDYSTFLKMRSRELRTGGILAFSYVARPENITDLLAVVKVRNEVLKRAVHSGKLSQEEFLNINYPAYFSSEEETLKPFKTENKQHEEHDLVLLHHELVRFECPSLSAWRKNFPSDGEKATVLHCRNIRRFHQALGYNILMNSLSDSRSVEGKHHIIMEVFDELEQDLRKDPGEYGQSATIGFVVCVKK